MAEKELPDLPSDLILALDNEDKSKEKDDSPSDSLGIVADDLMAAFKSGNRSQLLDALKLLKEI